MKKQTKKQAQKSDGLDQRIDLVLEILKGEQGNHKLLTQGNSFDMFLVSIVVKTLMKTKEGKKTIESFCKQKTHNKKKCA